MRCSQRALDLEASATLALAARVKALRAEGRMSLVSAGEPDLAPPAAAVAAVRQAIEDGKNGTSLFPARLKLGGHRGLSSQGWCGLHCGRHCADRGGQDGALLGAASAAGTRPGDEVVILTPAWVSYKPMIELCGGKVVEVLVRLKTDSVLIPRRLRRP